MAITVEDLKKMPTKYKIVLGVALALLLLYFYYFYFFQAALEKKIELTEKLENLEQQIAKRRVVALKIEKHKKEIAELNKNLQIALAKLPERKEIPNLLKSVSEAGREENLS
ncbi:MAG: type 4a pilus biogenesis protein PilO, partial [Syntrophales bacterium]|nr:type 4a pilus biogenesis protein PilO [Syntrophales bacterium]